MTKTKIGTATVSDGTASTKYTIPSTATVGDHSLIATYQENSQYMEGTGSNSFKIRLPTTITVEDVIGSVGETVTLSAHVYYSGSNPVDSGSVQFQIDGANVSSQATVNNGVATVTYTVTSTNKNGGKITANYLGTSTYGTSSTTLEGKLYTRKDPTIQVSNLPGNRSSTIKIPVTVSNSDGDSIDGTIQFYLDGTLIQNNVTLSKGSATLEYNIGASETVGGHTIKIIYLKNDNYNSAETTATLTVRTPTTVTCTNISVNSGTTATLSATITGPTGQVIPSGTVTFTLPSGNTVDATVSSSGIATAEYPISDDATGTLNFSAAYVENVNYQGGKSTTDGVITIRKPTVITIDDSITANIGSTITLNAKVTSNGDNVDTGTVIFELETA